MAGIMMNLSEDGSSDFTSKWLALWAESTQDYAIFALAPDGRILTWNRGGELIHGYRGEEIIGQPFSVLYSEADRRARAPEGPSPRRSKQVGMSRKDGACAKAVSHSGRMS
jgi:PAS domain S-box-containing protein